MQTTKIVNWTLGNGKVAECEVEVTRKMDLNDINASFGGKHPVELLSIEINVDGKFVAQSLQPPSIATNLSAAAVKAGGYARVGDSGVISKAAYGAIMAAIAEATAEAETDPEWAANKIRHDKVVAQNASELAAYNNAKANSGICPHCGGHCYGDCQAN